MTQVFVLVLNERVVRALEKRERNNVRGVKIDAPEMISLGIAGKQF